MESLIEADRQIVLWQAERDAGIEVGPIDRRLVHKTFVENVFVSRVVRLRNGSEDGFLAQLYVDGKHDFFFEHALDHIPGLLLIEAGRQAGTAFSHMFLEVEYGKVFVLQSMQADFQCPALLSDPVFLVVRVLRKQYRKQTLVGLECEAKFCQNGQTLGSMAGAWSFYDPRMWRRMFQAASH